MQSFYLRFRVYLIRKWPFYWNLTSNLQSSLVFLYANSLYASLFLESLSLEYNKVHLYFEYYLRAKKHYINVLKHFYWDLFLQPTYT